MIEAGLRHDARDAVFRNGGQMRIHFIVAATPGVSGQRAASETLIEHFRGRGWAVAVTELPFYDRGAGPLAPLRYGLTLLSRWFQIARRRDGPTVVHLSLGQSAAALVRDGVAFLLTRTRCGIVALHGSLFLHWSPRSFRAAAFRRLAAMARQVIVLGPTQARHLIEMGVSPSKVVWIDNCAGIEAPSRKEVTAKHDRASSGTIRVLYLSALIESKGFVEYVEALRILAKAGDGPVIEAVLCGPPESFRGVRFRSAKEAAEWIENVAGEINGSCRVRLRWQKGSNGAAKAALFRDAHIFVLPTYYPVEAQPIALLEAMAGGAAIVTSRAGEIPTTCTEHQAILLNQVTAAMVAAAIMRLSTDHALRKSLALSGLALFGRRFTREIHCGRYGGIAEVALRAAQNTV